MKNDYYTYAYLREDGTPYYIGLGQNKRAFNWHRHCPVPPRNRILFLKRNLTREEAIRHEIYLIAILGRKNIGTGRLINLTAGGESKNGFRPTEEQKEKWRGENNSQYGKTKHTNSNAKLTEEQRKQIVKESIPRGKGNGYGNHSELAERYGVDATTIRRVVAAGG